MPPMPPYPQQHYTYQPEPDYMGTLAAIAATLLLMLCVVMQCMSFTQLTRLLTRDGRRCVYVHDQFEEWTARSGSYADFVMHLGGMSGYEAGSHMHGCKIHEGKAPAAFTVLNGTGGVETYRLSGDKYSLGT